MTISMYSASVPVLQRHLGALLACLDKAQAHAETRKFSPDNYVTLRLAPDMLPFASQIRIAGDTAKAAVARLSGQEAPAFADDETTFDQLRSRIQKTLDYIASVPASAIDGSDARAIVLPMRNRDPLHFTGEAYLTQWVLPNFFFHVTTAYALLRHAGVALGKADFLAS